MSTVFVSNVHVASIPGSGSPLERAKALIEKHAGSDEPIDGADALSIGELAQLVAELEDQRRRRVDERRWFIRTAALEQYRSAEVNAGSAWRLALDLWIAKPEDC